MGKIILDLPEDLHRRIKSEASLKGVYLKDYVIHILKEKNNADI
jgi:predicted HicB family RNase H-like nuclease